MWTHEGPHMDRNRLNRSDSDARTFNSISYETRICLGLGRLCDAREGTNQRSSYTADTVVRSKWRGPES